WSQSIVTHPKNPVGWEKLASLALERGDQEMAWHYCESGLDIAPTHWRLLHRKALILRFMNRPAEALATMRLAAAQPNADKARANLALMLLERGRLEEARSFAEAAVKMRNNIAHNQRVLGQVAWAQQDRVVACKAFARALLILPPIPK
ncbi:hypothetical protein MUP37_03025, partial [Candidatus Bathyarchaeota archaeon]|nr:hypothetical protein [Candidatus Bathyarchaeota archaeon]